LSQIIFESLELFCPMGGVYFDSGANFGLCTFGLLPSMKSATLSCHLFEANPALVSYLESSSALFPSVQMKIVQGCLSDQAGASRFQISEQSTGHSHVDSSGSSLVGNIVLDAYVEENRIEKVNFLKIDIEPLTGNLRTDVLAIHEVLIEGNKA
jgi:FkbM family methyltransferase